MRDWPWLPQRRCAMLHWPWLHALRVDACDRCDGVRWRSVALRDRCDSVRCSTSCKQG